MFYFPFVTTVRELRPENVAYLYTNELSTLNRAGLRTPVARGGQAC